MEDDASGVCLVVLPSRLSGDTTYNDNLMTRLIIPVLERRNKFKIKTLVVGNDTGGKGKYLQELQKADLVIIDVSEKIGQYYVGVRHATGRPFVVLNKARSYSKFEWKYSVQLPIGKNKVGVCEDKLDFAIKSALAEKASSEEGSPEVSLPPSDINRRQDLAKKIDEIVYTIEEFRFNLPTDVLQQLRDVAIELRDNKWGDAESPVATGRVTIDALRLLSSFFDIVGSRAGVKVIVAGAVAGLLGGGGWPTAAVYALTLAAWEGSGAFSQALNRVFPHSR